MNEKEVAMMATTASQQYVSTIYPSFVKILVIEDELNMKIFKDIEDLDELDGLRCQSGRPTD